MRATLRLLPPILLALGLAACDPAGPPPPSDGAPFPAQTPVPERTPRPEPRPAPLPPPPASSPPLAAEPAPVRPDPRPAAPPPPRAEGRLPLARILAIAQREAPGEVIEVDLDEDDDDDDPPVYKLKILTPEGRAIEMELDARTGAIIEIEED